MTIQTGLSNLMPEDIMKKLSDDTKKAVYAYRYGENPANRPVRLFDLGNEYGKLDAERMELLHTLIRDNKRSESEDVWDVIFITRYIHCEKCGIYRAFAEEDLSYFCPVCEQDYKEWSTKPEIQP